MDVMFGDGFRKELLKQFHHIINEPTDPLEIARRSGMGGLATWIRDEAYPELREALDAGEPSGIHCACARIALGAMMLTEASDALGKALQDTFEMKLSKEEEHRRIGEVLKGHHRATLTGAQMIASERDRQIRVEGWTAEHDDAVQEYGAGTLAHAAIAYATAAGNPIMYPKSEPPSKWPWDGTWWKPASAIRMLVKAGALIAAEIDRRLRAGETP